MTRIGDTRSPPATPSVTADQRARRQHHAPRPARCHALPLFVGAEGAGLPSGTVLLQRTMMWARLRLGQAPMAGPVWVWSRRYVGKRLRMTEVSRGIEPAKLDDNDLRRELLHLHDTRPDTVLGGSEEALQTHTRRMLEMEREFWRRFPGGGAPDLARSRAGSRHTRGRR
jgi:hypothetical protein